MAKRKRQPRCIVIAGPNGAGKTTFARQYLPEDARVIHFVNADLIAGGLSPLKPELATIAAARMVLREIDRLRSVHLALRRIAARVRQGGHDVPRTDVDRRFSRGWGNFQRIYRPLADAWAVYDNSDRAPRLLEKGP